MIRVKLERHRRHALRATLTALAAGGVLCGAAAAQAASGRVATIVAGSGETVTLEGDGAIRCVYDGHLSCALETPGAANGTAENPKLPNFARSQGDTVPPAVASGNAMPIPSVLAETTVVFAAIPSTFTITFTLPTSIPGASQLGGSVAGSVTDADNQGTGGVGTSGADPLYVALVDGNPVAGTELHAAPFAVPGPGVPAPFAFAGATETVAASSFGLPTLSKAGPAVTMSIGVRLNFVLAGGDTAGFVVLLAAASGAAAMTLGVGDAIVALDQNDLDCVTDAHGSACAGESAGIRANGVALEKWNLRAEAAGTGCPALVAGNIGVKNLQSMNATVTIVFTLPTSPIGPTSLIGGSVGGAVVDGGFDAVGGIGTVTPNALYTALVDAMPVATLHADPFAVPGPAFPGNFAFAGEAENISAASFGLPGPTVLGPAVTTSIGIRMNFTLAPHDVTEITSMFVADCVRSPTSTPTITPTWTPTSTPSQTPTVTSTGTATRTASRTATVTASATRTPVPVGGACMDTSQCAAGLFCTDGVCCTSRCDGPLERCDVPPDVGTCTNVVAPAPALSPSGIWIGIGTLLAVAAAALWRRRRA